MAYGLRSPLTYGLPSALRLTSPTHPPQKRCRAKARSVCRLRAPVRVPCLRAPLPLDLRAPVRLPLAAVLLPGAGLTPCGLLSANPIRSRWSRTGFAVARTPCPCCHWSLRHLLRFSPARSARTPLLCSRARGERSNAFSCRLTALWLRPCHPLVVICSGARAAARFTGAPPRSVVVRGSPPAPSRAARGPRPWRPPPLAFGSRPSEAVGASRLRASGERLRPSGALCLFARCRARLLGFPAPRTLLCGACVTHPTQTRTTTYKKIGRRFAPCLAAGGPLGLVISPSPIMQPRA